MVGYSKHITNFYDTPFKHIKQIHTFDFCTSANCSQSVSSLSTLDAFVLPLLCIIAPVETMSTFVRRRGTMRNNVIIQLMIERT